MTSASQRPACLLLELYSRSGALVAANRGNRQPHIARAQSARPTPGAPLATRHDSRQARTRAAPPRRPPKCFVNNATVRNNVPDCA